MPEIRDIAELFLVPNQSQIPGHQIDKHIENFQKTIRGARQRLPSIECAPNTICLGPDVASVRDAMAPGGKINFSIMAIVHGNEVGGLPVLQKILDQILTGEIHLKTTIGIALGNVEAALAGRRFLDRDLNRSFGMGSLDATREGQRARELQNLLERSRFLLDIHQTKEPSETAFFIFPWTRKSFDFAQMISPEMPIVTHWGGSFSQDGMCSDEYVNARGGTGITIELGQNGFTQDQIQIGFSSALHALHATGSADVSNLPGLIVPQAFSRSIYTWHEIIPYPQSGVVALVPGLENFQHITAGTLIARHDDKNITAAVSGRILFPKYVRAGTPEAEGPKPAELCRIMKTIAQGELPK